MKLSHHYKYIMAAAMAVCGGGAMAQGLNSAYFTKDYKKLF